MDTHKLSRRHFVTGSAALAMGVLAGCAPTVVEKVVKETVVVKEQVTAAPAPVEPVTLRINARTGDDDVVLSAARQKTFMENNPNITLKNELIADEYYAKLEMLLVSGTAGDIFYNWSAGYMRYAAMGLSLPITDLLDARGFDTGVFYPAVVQGLTYQGMIYGMPTIIHPGYCTVTFNKTLLDQVGAAVPPENGEYTLDDWIAAAKAATKDTTGSGKTDQFGIQAEVRSVGMTVYARMWETDWLSEDGTKCLIDTPECREAVKFMYDLFQTHKVSPTSAQVIDNMFLSGKVAMRQGGSWNASTSARKTIGDLFEVGFAPMPKGPTGKRGSEATINSYQITKTSKHPDEALTYIESLSSYEACMEYQRGNGWGARMDAGEDPEFRDSSWHKVVRTIMGDLMPMRHPANFSFEELEDTFSQQVEPMWLGETTPDEHIPILAKALQDVLDKPMA